MQAQSRLTAGGFTTIRRFVVTDRKDITVVPDNPSMPTAKKGVTLGSNAARSPAGGIRPPTKDHSPVPVASSDYGQSRKPTPPSKPADSTASCGPVRCDTPDSPEHWLLPTALPTCRLAIGAPGSIDFATIVVGRSIRHSARRNDPSGRSQPQPVNDNAPLFRANNFTCRPIRLVGNHIAPVIFQRLNPGRLATSSRDDRSILLPARQ